MSKRSDEKSEPLSPTSAAACFRAFTTAQDALAIHRFIIGAAAHGDGVEDDPKLRKGYVELAARYLWSPIKAQTPTAKIELGDLSTMEGCLAAIQVVAQAQAGEHTSVEQVEGALKTVERAMQVHRSQAGERALDALEAAGAEPIYLAADMDIEEAAAYAVDRLRAQQAESN